MVIKSQILIRASAWKVFECIVNPFEKIKWMKGMIDSSFCFNEARSLNGKPVVFKEIMKNGEKFYSQPVALVSFKQASHIELKYDLKSYSVNKIYIVRAVGNYSILELTYEVSYTKNNLQRMVSNFLGRHDMKKNVESELTSIKGVLDYDFVQVIS